jgi:hypothetical protein
VTYLRQRGADTTEARVTSLVERTRTKLTQQLHDHAIRGAVDTLAIREALSHVLTIEALAAG